MCGIVGIAGEGKVSQRLIQGLKNLEYRGYDSSGIAVLKDGKIERIRSAGKIANLKEKWQEFPIDGEVGIAHTRWATHGAPVETNAHPHMTDRVAVVHNGIIENFAQLKKFCQEKGCVFTSDTDTEVIVHLITLELEQGCQPLEAVQRVVPKLTGAFALAIIFHNYANLMIAVRQGPPLAIGYGDGENYLGSDSLALAIFTNKISYLEDGDIVTLTKDEVKIYNRAGDLVQRKIVANDIESAMIMKGKYRHYMQKEIYEQPQSLSHSLSYYIDFANHEFRRAENIPQVDWQKIDHICFSACGTAYYATMVAKYWFEKYARLSVETEVASEYRYRDLVFRPDSLGIFVSQSGETADSLASLRYFKQNGVETLAVVNVPSSTIAREADYVFPTLCGPEIGVASTKAFTSQLAVLMCLALQAGVARGFLSKDQLKQHIEQMQELPSLTTKVLKLDETVRRMSHELAKASDVLYVGRGTSYPIALEGALKLKELSYLHAEGYAAGELKHGPISLIDDKIPTIAVAPHDKWFEKTVSNIEEVMARGGSILLLTDEKGADAFSNDAARIVLLPQVGELIAPIIYAIPIQLIAYHVAVFLGTDVDQPRNLAKSVTVE